MPSCVRLSRRFFGPSSIHMLSAMAFRGFHLWVPTVFPAGEHRALLQDPCQRPSPRPAIWFFGLRMDIDKCGHTRQII